MNDNGYVYVLMNPSMPNLVKIGKTQRTPEERAKELSATTGVPTPFTVVYDNYFENCSHAEQHVHTLLENKGYRVSKNREFFEMPIKDAIDAVMETKNYFGVFQKDNSKECTVEYEDREPWEDFVEIAEGYEYGTEDYIQNYNDAITYYLKAIKLGYKFGYDTIGYIYLNDLDDEKNAFKYFEKGTQDGCMRCYATLGFLYSYENFEKAKNNYELYMKYIPEEELSTEHMCEYFIFTIIEMSIYDNINEIKYFSKILRHKRRILQNLKTYNYTPLVYEYKTFNDLPSTIQFSIEQKSKEHSYLGYLLSKYNVEYRVEKNILMDYAKLIFESDYVSPDEYEGVICTIEVDEVSKF